MIIDTEIKNFYLDEFQPGYMYKMHLLGYAITTEKNCELECIDIYLRSHNLVYCIKTNRPIDPKYKYNFTIERFDDIDCLRFPSYCTVIHSDKRKKPILVKTEYYYLDKSKNIINLVDPIGLKDYIQSKRPNLEINSDPVKHLGNSYLTDRFKIIADAPYDIAGTFIDIDKDFTKMDSFKFVESCFPESKCLYYKVRDDAKFQLAGFEQELKKFKSKRNHK